MASWHRVFAARETMPEPAGVEARLAGLGAAARVGWAASAGGWYRAEIALGDGPPLVLERWLADEEGIRAELNAWAGWLETCEASPHHQALMERVIQCRQLFTLARPEEENGGVCVALARYLAEVTGGVYQVDGGGFFAADGTLQVREE
jgi:hypothetical protein